MMGPAATGTLLQQPDLVVAEGFGTGFAHLAAAEDLAHLTRAEAITAGKWAGKLKGARTGISDTAPREAMGAVKSQKPATKKAIGIGTRSDARPITKANTEGRETQPKNTNKVTKTTSEAPTRKLARPKGLGKNANQTKGSTDTEKDEDLLWRQDDQTSATGGDTDDRDSPSRGSQAGASCTQHPASFGAAFSEPPKADQDITVVKSLPLQTAATVLSRFAAAISLKDKKITETE